MYDDIAEEVGMDKSTLATFKSVSQSVEPLLRNKDLSFNHHKEVTSLPPEKQTEFLNRAVEEKKAARFLLFKSIIWKFVTLIKTRNFGAIIVFNELLYNICKHFSIL